MARKKQAQKTINPELENKLKKNNDANDSFDKPKTRYRRTKEEVQKEKIEKAKKLLESSGISDLAFDDTGFEMVRDIIYTLHSGDVSKYGVAQDPKEFYEDYSRNLMKIINFYTKGYAKPIYILIVTTLWQSYAMLKGRADKINKIEAEQKKIDESNHVENIRG